MKHKMFTYASVSTLLAVAVATEMTPPEKRVVGAE